MIARPLWIYYFFVCLLVVACSPKVATPPVVVKPAEKPVAIVPDVYTAEDQEILSILKKEPALYDSLLNYRRKYNIRIIYSSIDRNHENVPTVHHHYFNRNTAKYFYPASTVKLPIVLLALQKLNELRRPGLTRQSTMITEATYQDQTPVYNDPTTADGKPNIAQYIKKILLVSDNDAYNRLYEFLGQDYINSELQKRGYTSARIVHRLDVFLSAEANARTNPIYFLDESRRKIYEQQGMEARLKPAPANSELLGDAYYSKGQLIKKPMDFSSKNKLSLEDLHTIVQSVVMPETVEASKRFNITEDDRHFVLDYMSRWTSESSSPYYGNEYKTNGLKFLYFGGLEPNEDNDLRSFGKSGQAYGFLLESAYFVDFQKDIEFFLSAVIYANSDGILNDDRYDYEKIAMPFLKNLGRTIYAHELKRKRMAKPILIDYLIPRID